MLRIRILIQGLPIRIHIHLNFQPNLKLNKTFFRKFLYKLKYRSENYDTNDADEKDKTKYGTVHGTVDRVSLDTDRCLHSSGVCILCQPKDGIRIGIQAKC